MADMIHKLRVHHHALGLAMSLRLFSPRHRQYHKRLIQVAQHENGKKMRSMLYTDVHNLRFNGKHKTEQTIVAKALEQIQWAVLTMDDVCDGDTMRRGIPARHVTVGFPAAINDSLLMLHSAMRDILATRHGAHIHRHVLNSMISAELGQTIDLNCADAKFSQTLWEEMARLKTGQYSFFLPCVSALPGLSLCDEAQLNRVCNHAGQLFQAHNDLQGRKKDPSDKLTWFTAEQGSRSDKMCRQYMTQQSHSIIAEINQNGAECKAVQNAKIAVLDRVMNATGL